MMYVILAPAMGSMKVGVSKRPDERLKALQTSYPFPLEIAYVIPRGIYVEEKKFHAELRHFRRHGEWFEITPESTRLLNALLRKYDVLDAEGWASLLRTSCSVRGPWGTSEPLLEPEPEPEPAQEASHPGPPYFDRPKPRSRDDQLAWLREQIASKTRHD